MNNYSTTQTTNIVAIAGLISVIMAHFHVSISSDELQTFFGALLTVFGIGLNWYHRYQKGDLNLLGDRK